MDEGTDDESSERGRLGIRDWDEDIRDTERRGEDESDDEGLDENHADMRKR